MTVKEIIDDLKKMPEDSQVVVRIPHCCGQSGATEKAWFLGKVVPLSLEKLVQDEKWDPSHVTSQHANEDVVAIVSPADYY